MDNTTIIKRNPDIISADMKGETVMMSIKTGKYHAVNPVGARIWELLASPSSVEQIIDNLLEEFDVEREVCQKEVIQFLENSQNENLILID